MTNESECLSNGHTSMAKTPPPKNDEKSASVAPPQTPGTEATDSSSSPFSSRGSSPDPCGSSPSREGSAGGKNSPPLFPVSFDSNEDGTFNTHFSMNNNNSDSPSSSLQPPESDSSLVMSHKHDMTRLEHNEAADDDLESRQSGHHSGSDVNSFVSCATSSSTNSEDFFDAESDHTFQLRVWSLLQNCNSKPDPSSLVGAHRGSTTPRFKPSTAAIFSHSKSPIITIDSTTPVDAPLEESAPHNVAHSLSPNLYAPPSLPPILASSSENNESSSSSLSRTSSPMANDNSSSLFKTKIKQTTCSSYDVDSKILPQCEEKQQQREQDTLSRLVVMAKQQQRLSFTQAQLAAGIDGFNVNYSSATLPHSPKKPSHDDDDDDGKDESEKKLESVVVQHGDNNNIIDDNIIIGPIDTDSGMMWDEEAGLQQHQQQQHMREKSRDSISSVDESVAYSTAMSDTTHKIRNGGIVLMSSVPLSSSSSDDESGCWGSRKDIVVCQMRRRDITIFWIAICLLGIIICGSVAMVATLASDRKNNVGDDDTSNNNINAAPPLDNVVVPNNNASTSFPTFAPSIIEATPTTGGSTTLAPSDSGSVTVSYDLQTILDQSTSPTIVVSSSPPTIAPTIISRISSSSPSIGPTMTRFSVTTANYSQIGSDMTGSSGTDEFGFSMSLSQDGTIQAIGSRYHPSSIVRSGQVQVYQLSSNDESSSHDWKPLGQAIQGSKNNSEFGYSISISDDGNILAASEPMYHAETKGPRTGKVRIFQLITNTNTTTTNGTTTTTSSSWVPLGQELEGETGTEFFGSSVSLSGSGFRLAVGAAYYGTTQSGCVRIFSYSKSRRIWVPKGLALNGTNGTDNFGWDVSFNRDGNIMAASGPRNSRGGYVCVYSWSEQQRQWEQMGHDITSVEYNTTTSSLDRFGWSLSLSSVGNRIAIGAPYTTVNGTKYSGSVSVFEYGSTTPMIMNSTGNTTTTLSSSSSWEQVGETLIGTTPSESQFLGWSVALSQGGDHVVVGAPGNSNNGYSSGQVIVYDWNNNVWSTAFQPYLFGSNNFEDFGWQVDVALDGQIVGVGSPFQRNNARTGVTRVYSLTNE